MNVKGFVVPTGAQRGRDEEDSGGRTDGAGWGLRGTCARSACAAPSNDAWGDGGPHTMGSLGMPLVLPRELRRAGSALPHREGGPCDPSYCAARSRTEKEPVRTRGLGTPLLATLPRDAGPLSGRLCTMPSCSS